MKTSRTAQKWQERTLKAVDDIAPNKGWTEEELAKSSPGSLSKAALTKVAPTDDGSSKEVTDPADEEEAKKSKLKSVERKMYAKFEVSGARPKGSILHEAISFVLVMSALVVGSSAWSVLTQMMAPTEGNRTMLPPSLASATAPSLPPCTGGQYSCEAASMYTEVGEQVEFAFAISWPIGWTGLICLGLLGKRVDAKYRKNEHEVMQFRWDGFARAVYGLANIGVYVLMVTVIITVLCRGAVYDFLVFVIQALLGSLAIAVAWVLCFEGRSKRIASGAPSLAEVLQVKLDDKFQERVEGKKKNQKKQDKAAAKATLEILTCGAYRPRKKKPKAGKGQGAEAIDDDVDEKERELKDADNREDDEGEESQERPDNLAPSSLHPPPANNGISTFLFKKRITSTYTGKMNAEGQKHGHGIEQFSDGTMYMGMYAFGKREGRGTVLYADGRAQVSLFMDDMPVGDSVVWNAGRIRAWRLRDGDVLMAHISIEEATYLAEDIGLPMPPVHADDKIVEKEAMKDFVAAHPLSRGAEVRCFMYALMLVLGFDLLVKLMSIMWFIVRVLTSIPLYGCVPRLFYLEWMVHLRQKSVLSYLDYAALRPTSVALAPFFFCIYLPKMGINIPGIEAPDPDWPDIDWPDVKWPELKLPKVNLSNLIMLFKVRFPHVEWPSSPPMIGLPDIPSINLPELTAALRLKYPNMKWPEPPSLKLTFPDPELPGIELPDLFLKLRADFPDLAWPDLPEISLSDFKLPSFTLSQTTSLLKLQWPDLDWPEFSLPDPSLPNINMLLRLRFPDVNWPELPEATFPAIDLKMPTLDLSLVLSALKLKVPDVDWPTIPSGNGVSFPDWNFRGFSFPELFDQLKIDFPNLQWPELPELFDADWRLPELTLPQLGGIFKVRRKEQSINAIASAPLIAPKYSAIPSNAFAIPFSCISLALVCNQLKFPSLRWPDFSLPRFQALTLSQLNLSFFQLSGFAFPRPDTRLKALRLQVPNLSIPSIDIEMPDLSGFDVNAPNLSMPTIPVPTLDFPDPTAIDFNEYCTFTALGKPFSVFGICSTLRPTKAKLSCVAGGLLFAFLISLISDLKDIVLVIGKAKILMKKCVTRKQRMRAKEDYTKQVKDVTERVKRASIRRASLSAEGGPPGGTTDDGTVSGLQIEHREVKGKNGKRSGIVSEKAADESSAAKAAEPEEVAAKEAAVTEAVDAEEAAPAAKAATAAAEAEKAAEDVEAVKTMEEEQEEVPSDMKVEEIPSDADA